MLKLVSGRPHIRLLQEGDDHLIAAVYLMWQLLCREEGHPPANPQQWLEETRILLQSHQYLCFVAEVDGEIIGYLDLTLYDDPISGSVVAYGRNLYVVQRHRNTSVSMLLLLKSMRSLKAATVHKIILEALPEKQEMYRSAGFQQRVLRLEKVL